jgi:hypothetical protein
MDKLEELSSVGTKNGFFKHMFSFSDDDKGELINVVQYALLAIIPVIVLNKTMQKFVPEADDEKGSLEISAEVIFQIVYMFIGIYFINRLITYVPNYGGVKYQDFSVTTITLAVLVIILSLQTKLGEKVSILVERLVNLWEGKSSDPKKKPTKNGTVKVSQPISQHQMSSPQQMPQQMSMSTPISQLPVTQQLPNYDNMHQSDNNPLVGAASPGYENMNQGPMPASEFMGFSSMGGGFANF